MCWKTEVVRKGNGLHLELGWKINTALMWLNTICSFHNLLRQSNQSGFFWRVSYKMLRRPCQDLTLPTWPLPQTNLPSSASQFLFPPFSVTDSVFSLLSLRLCVPCHAADIIFVSSCGLTFLRKKNLRLWWRSEAVGRNEVSQAMFHLMFWCNATVGTMGLSWNWYPSVPRR